MKNIIVYIPFPIDENASSAPKLRARNMIGAFQELGYKVFVVSGYSQERREKIKEIKKLIKEGTHFEFLYAESDTTPIIFNDFDHIPRHPLQTLCFFKTLKKNDIPRAYFIRDFYNKFPNLKKDLSLIKYILTSTFFDLETKLFSGLLDIVYTPTEFFHQYIPQHENLKLSTLPPGCTEPEVKKIRKKGDKLNIIYVGGISSAYTVDKFLEAVSECSFANLTVCSRENEIKNLNLSEKVLKAKNISFISKNSKEIKEELQKVDLYCITTSTDIKDYYFNTIHYKSMEATSYLLPSIVISGSSQDKLFKPYNISWATKNEVKDIKILLEQIYNNPEEIEQKKKNCLKARKAMSWKQRAIQVVKDLDV